MGREAFGDGSWRQLKRYDDAFGKTDLIYPWDPNILIGSTAAHSKLDVYSGRGKTGVTLPYPVTYLRLYQKKPQVENLVTAGAASLLNEIIAENTQYNSSKIELQGVLKTSTINWRERSPSKMLGLTRDELRMCVADEWSLDLLRIFQTEKREGRTPSRDVMRLAEIFEISGTSHEAIRRNGADFAKTMLYIHHQDARAEHEETSGIDFVVLTDYWRIAADVGEDLKLPAVLYPPSLFRAHDRVEGVRRAREDAVMRAGMKARAKQFKLLYDELSFFSWERDGLLIRPCKTEAELRREGERLCHCVGSYADTHVRGNQPIFFIRRKRYPNTPFYTLQLDVDKLEVVQNRGLRNCARTPEVQAFESAWLEYLRELMRPGRRAQRSA
jgi:hypothetical protein